MSATDVQTAKNIIRKRNENSISSSNFSDYMSEEEFYEDDPVCRRNYQMFCALTGSMGLVSTGIFNATSGCILPQLLEENEDMYLTDDEASWFAGLGFVAGIIGSILGSYECELLGRKTCLMIENAMVFCALILMGIAPSFIYLIIGRSVHGYCYGSITGAVPIYVSEVCQPQVRSIVGGAAGVFYCVATASVFTIGAMLPWRWLLLVCSVFPFVNFVLLMFASESPTWYLLRGRPDDALNNLHSLRGDPVIAEREYARMMENYKRRQECAAETENVPKWRMMYDLLTEPTFLNPFVSLVIVYVGGIILSGVSLITLYLNTIIIKTGAPGDPYWIGAGLMAGRAITSLVSSALLSIFPRRVLFTIGVSIMAVADLILGISVQYDLPSLFGVKENVIFQWLPVIGISLVYFGLSSGLIHVILCLQGELLPSFGRAIGSGLIGVFDALFMFMAGKFLPDLEKAIGLGHIFVICTGVNIGLIVFVWLFVPETRGLSLEEIEEYYRVRCYGEDYDFEKVSKQLDRLSMFDTMSMWGDELRTDRSDTISVKWK